MFCIRPTESEMLEPLSAKIISPGKSLSKIPEFSVMYLSLACLPHISETNDVTPYGVTLTVLWCL